MNYASEVIYDFPFDNPVTKVACMLTVGYLAYLGVKYAKKDEHRASPRRERKGFTSNAIDHAIHDRNIVLGGPVPGNPEIPHYSRHNYNRRRRSKNFY